MDIATLIGIVSGMALVVVTMAMGSPLSSFVNAPGLIVVLGGTIAATLINERLSRVIGASKVCMQAFFDRNQSSGEMIDQIVELATKARKEGLVSLEGETIEDEFLARGVRLGVDGLSPEVISSTLAAELQALRKRHERGQKIFKFMGATAPAMGMVGTLIGLVQMLQNMEDPAAIGPAMAVALLTTLYGAILAFMIFNPIAQKLEVRTAEETARKTLAMVGVGSILKGDNSLVIQSKLESYLSPVERLTRAKARS